MRKGQKLINFLLIQGYNKKELERIIFYMLDDEFDKIINKEWEELSNKKGLKGDKK